MQISTTARHCELDSELRAFAQQRLEKITRFARDIHEAHLTITAEKFRHVAEIQLKLDHHEMVIRDESPEMRMAIDRAIDRLEQQLRRLKERRVDRKRDGRDGGVAPLTSPEAETIEDEEFEG
jgi:putative sigma-54 modulation protein